MGRICQSCHARIDDGMKICPNCGRVVPSEQIRREQEYQPAPRRVYEHPKRQTTPPEHPRQQPSRAYEERKRPAQPVHAPVSGHKKKKSKLKIVRRIVIAAVVLLALYALIFVVQVLRIRRSTYDFSLEMTMTRENYGEVIDEYFQSGSWSYNPFTFTATFTGVNSRNEEYEISFRALLDVNVSALSIDGERIQTEDFETRIMGMFI